MSLESHVKEMKQRTESLFIEHSDFDHLKEVYTKDMNSKGWFCFKTEQVKVGPIWKRRSVWRFWLANHRYDRPGQ